MYTSRRPDHPFPRTMMDVQSGPGKAGRPATKPKATKADISRERVLLAAAQIFAEMGYAGTTMRAVAERVGLRAASLYYHYRSKEDLVEAVLATGTGSIAGSVQQALAQLPADTSARERIESALAAHLGSIISLGDFARATRRVLAQLPAPLRRKHVALRDAGGFARNFEQLFVFIRQRRGRLYPEAAVRASRPKTFSGLRWTGKCRG